MALLEYVAFVYSAFVQFCEAVVFCLSKVPDGPNKELNDQ